MLFSNALFPCPMFARLFTFVVLLSVFSGLRAAQAQPFDASWYRATPSAKIAVAADGVYRVTGAELQAAGFPLGAVSQLELVLNGRQVPFLRLGSDGATLAAGDTIVFVGRRNRGTSERDWAYLTPDAQSSDHYSLYTDTSYYWLRSGATSSLRYQTLPTASTLPALRTSLPDTVHYEVENVYYAGDASEAGNPMYSRGEAYFINNYLATGLRTSETGARLDVLDVATPNVDAASADSVRMWARLAGGSGSRHRAALRLGTTATDLSAAEWQGYAYAGLYASITPATVAAASNKAQIRVRHLPWYDGVSFSNGGLSNSVYTDYVRVAYPRLLRGTAGQDDFWTPGSGAVNLSLGGYTGATRVLALMPEAVNMADLSVSAGAATLAGAPSGSSSVWTSTRAALKVPTRISLYGQPAVASLSGADYVIVTTALLRPSAEALAAYHRTHDGLTTEIVLQDDLFQQFDFGRPTPVAMRRFVQAATAWGRPARYLVLLGDALLAKRNRPVEPWEVITFGDGVSDAWMAMTSHTGAGRVERVALGRLPIRTNTFGSTFLAKLQAYNDTPGGLWQKRAVYVAGGPNPSDRSILQSAQRSWASTAATAPSAMDTTLFFRSSPFPADGSYSNDGTFRTRITSALQQGAALYSYYGHSSPSVLEVITDNPAEMENAPRIPLFLSLGCSTGAFANGTATLDTRSFAEDLVISDVDGGIAHWGSSALSNTGPSSALASNITSLVFRDTMRVIGDVFRIAKQRFAESNNYPLADRHALQYFLIGDPYTRLRIENKPNFAATTGSLFVGKDAPVVSDGVLDVTARVFNYGLAAYTAAAPTDSVTVRLSVTASGQTGRTFSRRVRVLDSLDVSFRVPLVGAGEHTLRLSVDPENAFAEASETDNAAERRVTVYASGLALAYPARLGITGTTPTLRVTPSTPSGSVVPVLFELDSTATFTSSFKRTFRTSGATVASWTVASALSPGVSYYWRARIDEAGQENVWVNGTFTVDPAAGEGMIVQASQRSLLRSDSVDFAAGTWRFQPSPVEVQINGGGGPARHRHS